MQKNTLISLESPLIENIFQLSYAKTCILADNLMKIQLLNDKYGGFAGALVGIRRDLGERMKTP